jgi:hypothetical protein
VHISVTILSCASASNLNAFSRLQKKAIRIMTKSTYNAHTGPLFIANRILPFDKLILQNKLLFFHSIEFNYAPRSFVGIWTKNTEREFDYNPLRNFDQYTIAEIKIELFRHIPLVSLPTAWNNLNEGLRFQHNSITFKIALFDHLLGELTTRS